MFTITNILNPLTGGTTTKQYKWRKGRPLSKYMGYSGECLVACGGVPVDLPLDKIFPARREEYVVMPVPEGGDRQSWRILGYFAMSAASLIPVWGAPVALVGSNLVRLFLQDKEKDQTTSQSYSWRYVSSLTAGHGTAMPVIYGKARVRPTLKNRYVTVEGDKQRLYALYGVAAHKVDERAGLPNIAQAVVRGDGTEFMWDVAPGETFIYRTVVPAGGYRPGYGMASFYDDVVINGQAIQSYDADVEWETRPGLPDQAVMIGFDVTYANYAQDSILYLNYPEINNNVATFTLDSDTMILYWNEHPLLYQGITHTIQRGDERLLPSNIGKTHYAVWDSTGFSVPSTKYAITTASVLPAGVFPLYSFILTASDITNKTYISQNTLPASTDWITPIAPLTNLHNIELTFEFPYGLYGQTTEDIVAAQCRIFAQYREAGTNRWLNFDFQHLEDSSFDYSYAESTTELGIGTITRTQAEAFNIILRAVPRDYPLSSAKTYEMRVAASSPSIVKLVNVATLVYGAENADGSTPGFTYPGEPLLGIKALASGQLSSDLDVQVDVERSLVWVYNTRHTTDRDGNASNGRWVRGAANNHAWAVYDILANGHPDHPAYPTAGNDDAEGIYGCGVDKGRLDYESFRTWSEHVNGTDEGELGYELNIVFDTFMTAWDAILRICQEGRGMIYPVGTKIYAYVDKAEDVSQVFTMGNIQLNTFVQKYLGAKNKANMLEATYYDVDNNYSKTTVAARTSNWDSSTDLNTPIAATLYGTITFKQAMSIAWFLLRGNELLDNAISFGVDVDSLAVQAGGVVDVQHDVLTAGEGGRITTVSGTPGASLTITLDRTLTTIPGRYYTFTVWHNDGTIETQTEITISFAAGNVIAFPDSYAWDRIPAQYELYSFGPADTHLNTYRVAEISRTSELMRTLTLVQYDGDLYDGPTPITSPFPMEKPAADTTILNLASRVRLQEVLSHNRITGEYESSIAVAWDTADGDPRGTWEVYYRDVDGSDIDWKGTWEEGEYDLYDKVELDGVTYISLEAANTSVPFSR